MSTPFIMILPSSAACNGIPMTANDSVMHSAITRLMIFFISNLLK